MSDEKTVAEIEQEIRDHYQKEDNPQGTKETEKIPEPETREYEKTSAEIEKEIRERKQKEKQAEYQGSEQKPHEPEINKLKKRNKHKILFKIAFASIGIIVVLFIGSRLWSAISSEETTDGQAGVADKSGGGSSKRTDLGQGADPFGRDTPAAGAADNQVGKTTSQGASGSGDTKNTPPVVTPRFQRYMALEAANESVSVIKPERQSDNVDTSPQGKDKPETTTNSQAAEQPPEAALSVIKRIPYDPDLYLPENTAIPCALTRRLVTEVAGKLQCVLTEDVYSASGNTKLLDKGTVASLRYQTGNFNHGQARVFLLVEKMRTKEPPFLDIPMLDTNAAGALGEGGVDGWVDTHFGERFIGAMMVAVIPDVSNAVTNNSGQKDRNTDYTENSRQAFADIAKTAFDNSVNIPPTLYKNQGEVITLITGRDLDFSHIYKLALRK